MYLYSCYLDVIYYLLFKLLVIISIQFCLLVLFQKFFRKNSIQF